MIFFPSKLHLSQRCGTAWEHLSNHFQVQFFNERYLLIISQVQFQMLIVHLKSRWLFIHNHYGTICYYTSYSEWSGPFELNLARE